MIPDIPQSVLRKNHRQSFPSRVLYLDTESKKQVQGTETHLRTCLAWTCYVNTKHGSRKPRETWTEWRLPRELCEYIRDLARDGDPLLVVGHNVYFDLQSSDFFYYFTRWKWQLDFYYDKGLTYILSMSKDKQRIRCISTTNYYDTSLLKLGEMVGLPKISVDFDAASEEELSVYCRRDCAIVKKVFEEFLSFVDTHDLGKFALTRAGQAYAAYRHRFMDKKIYLHRSPEIKELERASYFGGRTECFRFGVQPRGDYVSLDVNSMYPFIMASRLLPSKCIDYKEDVPVDELYTTLTRYGACAEVEIETEEPVYAVRVMDKVIFPVGVFTTFVCTPSLMYALDHHHLKKVRRMSVYKMDYLFEEYVEYFYGLKLEAERKGNEIKRRLAKYLMNSLYGRFGMKCTIQEKWPEVTGDGYYRVDNVDAETLEHWCEYKILNTVVYERGEREMSSSMVAIPAHITDYGRILLWEIISQAGRDRVYYCDTDSVKIKREDMERITYPVSDVELGALSVESEFAELTLWGAKHYVCGDEVKIKGVPRSAEKLAEFSYRYTEFLRQSSHLRRGITRYYILEERVKDVSPQYDKGEVGTDGIIYPFRLEYGGLPALLPYRPFPRVSAAESTPSLPFSAPE